MKSIATYKARKIFTKALFIIGLILFAVFICIPLYWAIVTSLKTTSEIVQKNVTLFPKNATFANYIKVWKVNQFSVYFKNTAFIAILSVLFVTAFSIPTGYALARFKFKGKTVFLLVLLCTQFIPSAMMLAPMFMIFKNLKMLSQLFPIAIIVTVFQVPFNSILMQGFISGIDYSIEEAAIIDGCSRPQAIWYVVCPLLKPAIATVAAKTFISGWNEFLYSFMLISKKNKLTLSIALKSLLGEFSIDFGLLAAGAIISVLPSLILFGYAQKHLTSGLAAGGVKG